MFLLTSFFIKFNKTIKFFYKFTKIKYMIKKSIALYGGAFDPPHIAHINLIKKL
jgi:hypothetical protein